jgi:hypothetical protein
VEQITWHYGQAGPQVFFGDIAFYSGEWDAGNASGVSIPAGARFLC